jgi:OOP family OmpA-OmpF porin
MMSWMKKATLVTLAGLLTGSCAMYRLEELRHTTPAGTRFQNELSKLYMDFATQEEKDYDWGSSMYFAGKGLRLAYGKDVGPEELADWNLPADKLADMEAARASLMGVLTPAIMNGSPSRAADAQFFFDCWVEQQEENWQDDDIAYCRDGLAKTLDELHGISVQDEPAMKPAKKTRKQVAAKQASDTPVTAKQAVAAKAAAAKDSGDNISYAVFFESGSAQLSDTGKNVVDEVLKSLKDSKDVAVVLHAGSDKLSDERSNALMKILVDAGVPEGAVSTAGDKAPRAAKRVDIYLNE